MAAATPRILHLLAAFEEDPLALRTVRLINGLGAKAEHAIVADDRERRGAARLLAKSVRVTWPRFPALKGSKLPGRLAKLAAAMRGYDLICTYGASGLDAAFAHTLFADLHKLAPLVHHELSDAPAEVGGRGRAWYRRFALGRSAALIVSTKALESLALEAWDQPRPRVRLIPDGIDTRSFATPVRRDQLPGLIKRRDELWLGTFTAAAGDEPLALVRALAQLPPLWQLVVAGEPSTRAAQVAEAEALGIEDRLHFASPAVDQQQLLALLDCLALPAPLPGERALVMQAMAAGLPILAPRDSEAEALVASDNGPLLFTRGDFAALADSLGRLTTPAEARKRIGQANRAKARDAFDMARMVERSWALYAGLMGRSARVPPEEHD